MTERGDITRPAWVRPSAVPDDHPLDSTDDVALALGGSPTSWTADVLRILAKSDPVRLAGLTAALPWYAYAYLWWRQPRTVTPTAGELLAEMARVEACEYTCQNHPEIPATHTATMPVAMSVSSGPTFRRELAPLAGSVGLVR